MALLNFTRPILHISPKPADGTITSVSLDSTFLREKGLNMQVQITLPKTKGVSLEFLLLTK